MLLVDALKEVYKALGGSADDVANMSQNADVIAAIATKAGSGLPEVSATDNGDVLTVVEGAWAKAEPSGGSDIVIYNVTSDAANKITLPCTYTELLDNVQNKDVILNVKALNTTKYTQMRCGGYDTNGTIFFIGIKSTPTTTTLSSSYVEFIYYSNIGIVHDATWSFTQG